MWDRWKRKIRWSESTPRNEPKGPVQMALPASSIPGMKEVRTQIILRRHSKCKKSDQGVAVVQARAYGGHTFLVRV